MPRRDVLWSTSVGLGSLAIYIRTLAPGLIPILDTPGFQFIGRVLGTMHNPGYPGFVMITHLWSYLPLGSLAYRINLFSAVMASLAVAGVFTLLRLLSVRRPIAAASALAMSFGSIYWSQAVIAEVYGLNAALIVWMLVGMVAWGHAKRPWMFYGSVALLALGLGNHTTIVLFAPVMLVFALATDWRWVVRPRTMLVSATILLAGVAQYLFVLWRTRIGSIYLESRASNLRELFEVMRGAQFEHALFAFTLPQVVSERVPLILGRFVAAELTVPVFVGAILGAVALTARRRCEALLLVLGGMAVLAFVLNYDAADIHVFTIPLLLILWCLAGYGLEMAITTIERRSKVVALAAAALVMLLPVWQLARNFTDRDLSDDTEAMRTMDALFETLPDDSFLVRHNFVLDRMLMYKLLGERAGGSREVQAHYVGAQAAASMSRSGRHVFAFRETAEEFRFEGIDVAFAPIPLFTSSLEERLRELPDDGTLVLAVPGAHSARSRTVLAASLSKLTSVDALTARDRAAFTLVLPRNSASSPRLIVNDRSAAIASVGGVTVSADAVTAGVQVHGRDLIRTEDGPVLAIVNGAGAVQSIDVLRSEAQYRIQARPGSFTPFLVSGAMPISALGEAPGLAATTGAFLIVRVPPGSHVTLSASAAAPCDLRAVDKSSSQLRIESVSLTGDEQRLLPRESGGYRHFRLVSASQATTSAIVVAGCAAPVYAWSNARGATVHAGRLTGVLDVAGLARDTLVMARTQQTWLLGGGWSAVSTEPDGPFRRMEGAASGLILPIDRPGTRLRVQARVEGPGPIALRLSIDGQSAGERLLSPGWHWYDWAIPGVGAGVHAVILERVQPGQQGSTESVAVAQIEVSGS